MLLNVRTCNILQNCNSQGNFVTRISPHLRGGVTPCTLESQTHEKMAGVEFGWADLGKHVCCYEGHKTRKT